MGLRDISIKYRNTLSYVATGRQQKRRITCAYFLKQIFSRDSIGR
jgi:hypothetical protein